MTRIAVLGGGSVGLAVAASLAQAGAAVTLLVRAGSVAALRDVTLTVGGMLGEHRIEAGRIAVFDADDPIAADVLIVTTKAQDVAAALAPFARDGAPRPGAVLLMQNGLGSADVAREVLGPAVPVFSSVMYIGMAKQGAAHVAVTAFASPVLAGSLTGDDIAALRPLLDIAPVGFLPIQHAPDLRETILRKLLFNSCLNPTGALTGLTYGGLLENPHTRDLITNLADETLRAYAAAADFRPARDGRDYVDTTLTALVFPKSAPHRSSMAQDLDAGRTTEIGVLNGAVIRMAREAGLATPCHETVVALIRARERA
jgi:2-dehydropantoate 2-reductase